MGAVAEGSPSIRAQANLSALGLHEMAASLPDYVRMVAAGERGFAVSVNIFFTIFTNVFSPIAPTRMRRIRLRGCAAFGV